MHTSLRRFAPVLGIAWLLGGCEGDAGNRFLPGGSSEGGAGLGGGDLTGGGGPDAYFLPDSQTGEGGGMVTVTITSPAENATVTGPAITVTADVIVTNAVIDITSVTAQLDDLTPVRMQRQTGNTFSAQLGPGSLASGRHTIIARASTLDSAADADAHVVLLNAGPVISFVRPGTSEPTKDELPYEFTVRIAPELSGIALANVSAQIGTCVIGNPVLPTAPGEFRGTKDLTTCSPRLLDGPQQLTVTATDTSNPAQTSTKNVVFNIDHAGPVIEVLNPTPANLVGGIIEVQARVTDPSGINPSTVYATISHGGAGTTFLLADRGDDTYSNSFDLRTLPASRLIQYPAVEVVADDTLQNHSTTGGILFTIDNTPPIGDFDPPMAYMSRVKDGVTQCSHRFDPVGTAFGPSFPDAPNDGDTVLQVFDLRAEISDFGNRGPGSDYGFSSVVTQASLYILDDTSNALIIDSDADGLCDAVNPDVIPTFGMPPGPTEALVVDMVQIPAGGVADFTPGGTDCTPGDDEDPPAALCDTTTMTVALYDVNKGREPLIWTLPPYIENAFQCQGLQFDALANGISDGWICVVAAFTDGVGNRSVSRPLRLCVDKDGSGDCVAPGAMPNCTQSCTPEVFGGVQGWKS